MAIRCPKCTALAVLADGEVGANGRLTRCRRCGTTWVARRSGADVFGRGPIRLQAPADVSDAIVIEHIGPGFAAPPKRATLASANRLGPRLAVLGAVLAGVLAVSLLYAPLVAALPDVQARQSDPAGLEFRGVSTKTIRTGSVETLLVEGELVNRSGRDMALPAIRIGLQGTDGSEVHFWLVEPSYTGLAAGRAIGFRSALAAPPPGASRVTLSLAEREGQTAGIY